jgi:drug/metabolite transporter (DMT)-like permease
MSLTVLALVIAAAVAHASWNLLAKPAEGGAAFVWLCAVAGTLVYLPVLAVALMTDPGLLGRTALALMGGSGALHALYFVLLQRAYGTGDLSVVYPLARGTGPLLSATAAIAFLGERPSLLALAGAALIVAAVFSLIRRSEGLGPANTGHGMLFAVLTGAATAGYTLWDKHAVGAAALARAPVSYVAPARESSIVVGTLLGTVVLHEQDRRRRLAGAAAILIGVVILTLG